MSAPRKNKFSRKDQQPKFQYHSILSVPLRLVNRTDQNAQEKRSSNDQNNDFLAGGRRSPDIHMIGLLDSWDKLSAREKEVTYLVCMRRRNDEIASEMGVTAGTVNSYLNHIYNKLNIRGKMDLFHMFYNFDFRKYPPYE